MDTTNLILDQAATKIQSLTRGHLARNAIKKGKALINQENICPITYDTINMRNSTLTSCGHVFNTEALSTWLERSVHCPSCRATIAPLPNQPVVEPNNGGELSQLTHLPDSFAELTQLTHQIQPRAIPQEVDIFDSELAS